MASMITAESAKVCESFQLAISLKLTNIHGMIAFGQTIKSQDSEFWQLLIQPTGNNAQSCDCCVLYTGTEDLRVQARSYQIFSSDDATGGKRTACFSGHNFPHKAGKPGDLSCTFSASMCKCSKWQRWVGRYVELDDLYLLPPNVIFEVVLTVHRQSHSKPQLMPSLNAELAVLYQEFAFAGDVTIVAGGERFTAHKLILSARSPVFKAMFESEMSESETSVVTIKDTKPVVFRLFLKYLYTDEYVASDDTLLGMYSLAHKYSMLALRDYCEQCLIDTLTLENVTSTLTFGQVYAAPVYNAAVKFIARNYKLLYQADRHFLASVGVDVEKDVLNALGIV